LEKNVCIVREKTEKTDHMEMIIIKSVMFCELSCQEVQWQSTERDNGPNFFKMLPATNKMWMIMCSKKDQKENRVLVSCVRFEVFTALAMKNGVFWDVTPYGSCKNRRFEGT
jgi:hypothetical protein